jgi:hypothetical protein
VVSFQGLETTYTYYEEKKMMTKAVMEVRPLPSVASSRDPVGRYPVKGSRNSKEKERR